MRDGVNVPRAGISRSSSPTTYGGDQRPRLTKLGKRLYARRKETVKRSFANAKKLHGHRYARFRGLSKIQAQCMLSAACQNMKKMALLLSRRAAALFALETVCLKGLMQLAVACSENRGFANSLKRPFRGIFT